VSTVSPSAHRREREKAEVRARILDAARELFTRQGYDAVTMRAIANRIGYTATALYFHFADKETLLRELCSEDFLNFSRQLLVVATILEPRERLRQMALAYIKFAIEYPNHYRFLFMTPLPAHEHDSRIRKGDPSQDAYAFLRQTVAAAIEAGGFKPQFEDADLVAQTLWSAVHGFVSLRIAMAHETWVSWVELERAALALLEAVMEGVVRPPP
jgi:AcrR family transcriptional regulator